MKTISLHQRWATLVAIGAKRYETRHWALFHTGALAIHAAKNSTPALRFDPQCSPEVRSAMEPHLAEWVPLAPAWCHEVRAGFDANTTDAEAWVHVPVPYRWARINACAAFLEVAHDRRRETMLHEVVHIHLEPLRDVVLDAMTALEPHPALRRLLEEQLRKAVEGATCDLTRALLTAADRTPAPSTLHSTPSTEHRP